jgi:protease-4
MSKESREQFEWLLDGIWGDFLETVTTQRNLGRADLEEALSRGILHPQEAVELGLVDAVRYREEILRQYVDDWKDTRLIDVVSYHRDWKYDRQSGKAIAVVHTRGLILRGRNDYSPGVGAIMGAGSVVRDLEDAAANDNVAAVVLRIDSPGGEIVASDMISHAVERVRRQKPIVVSMVDVAASGGYMMAFRASRIVALPSSITGSIGIVSEKLNVRGLYGKLGMTRDFVSRGSYPFLFSDYHDWSAAEDSLIARQQEMDYERWIADIADSRKLTTQMVDEVARGRVWTGQQALEHGLVDELGGQRQALELASELARLPSGTVPRLVHYPEERSFMDLLLEESDALWAGVLEHWGRGSRLPQNATWSILDLRSRP